MMLRTLPLYISLVLLAACNTTEPLIIKEASKSTITPSKLKETQATTTFALTKLVSDINRGDPIFAFPVKPTTKGTLCNHRANGIVTYAGGTRYIGDWSSELGKAFYQTLTRLNYKVAGDPSDMFTQQEAVRSAEYLIGGRLTQMKGNFCHAHHWWDGRPLETYSGELYVDFEWSILNTLTKTVIFKKTISGYYKQEEPVTNGILVAFENAFIASVEAFASNPEVAMLASGGSIPSAQANQTSPSTVTVVNGIKNKNPIDIPAVTGSVVTVRVGMGHGSGFFIGKDGYLLTNAHVVGKAQKVQIRTFMGFEAPAEVVSVDDRRDVALLKAQISLPSPLPISIATPAVATEIYAIGSPIKETLGNTVTKGIVSAIRTDNASGLRYIQADAAISPGSSGGPLFDSTGAVVGISVAKFSGGGAEGLGLFIPISDALKAVGIILSE